MRSRQSAVGGFAANRGSLFSIMRLLCHSVFTAAAPMAKERLMSHGGSEGPVKDTGDMLGYYVASAILVLAGGAFAGLTIALMGQDGIYLQVLAGDSSEPQSKNAQRVYDLLKRGKHWVLVTLLLSNVIVNETLPVVLDRCLGGGVAAVIGSTVLIVIFGEVIPQSVCVRFGLQIGGAMSKPVSAMMWLMAPVAWPIAKLLDWMLGEDHPTVYKKSGLKQLVNLHQTLGDVSNRLNADEVTIISAVLDLKDKPVKDVMTPMNDVFVMPDDAILDERMMDRILSAGYSRIPIHSSGNPTNFVGMLLVKILITYDPEDCKRVSDFSLATLPETLPDTNCLDIVNFFQEGKSHMVLVSNSPGEDHGALGVVTLEDVIEELIGEEIIDESDVFIDVHKAIRRLTPAPKARVNRHESDARARQGGGCGSGCITGELSGSPEPMTATFMMRASSTDGGPGQGPVAVRSSLYDMKSTLKRLGPSNPAANPKESKFTSVKIKHGLASPFIRPTVTEHLKNDYFSDEHTPLLATSLNTTEPHHRPLTGKGGVQALRKSYGPQNHDTQTHLSVPNAVGQTPQVTGDEQHPVISSAAFMSLSPVAEIPSSVPTVDAEPVTVAPLTQPEATAELPAAQDLPAEEPNVDGSTQTPRHPFIESSSTVVTTFTTETYDSSAPVPTPVSGDSSEDPEIAERNASEPHADSPVQSSAQSPPIDMPKGSSTPATDVTVYRTTTGSVFTESIIESQGVRKIVIHTTSSSDEAGPSISQAGDIQDVVEDDHNGREEASSSVKLATVAATSGKKKKNKKNKKARK